MNILKNLSDREIALVTGFVGVALKREEVNLDYKLPEQPEQLRRLGRQLQTIQYEIAEKLGVNHASR